jgi:hypothetical protein
MRSSTVSACVVKRVPGEGSPFGGILRFSVHKPAPIEELAAVPNVTAMTKTSRRVLHLSAKLKGGMSFTATA